MDELEAGNASLDLPALSTAQIDGSKRPLPRWPNSPRPLSVLSSWPDRASMREVNDISLKLKDEGFASIQDQPFGKALRRQLRLICDEARKMGSDRAAL